MPVLDNQWYQCQTAGHNKQRHLFGVVDSPGLLHLSLEVFVGQLTPLLHIPNRVDRSVPVCVHC